MNSEVRKTLIAEFKRQLRECVGAYEQLPQGGSAVFRKPVANGYRFIKLIIPAGNRFSVEMAQSASEPYPSDVHAESSASEWRKRIGHLLGNKLDVWWDLDNTSTLDVDAIARDMADPSTALRNLPSAITDAIAKVVQVERMVAQ